VTEGANVTVQIMAVICIVLILLSPSKECQKISCSGSYILYYRYIKKTNKFIKGNSVLFLKLGTIKIWSSPRVNSRDLLFTTYINLPQTMITLLEPTADDTIVVISGKNVDDLCLMPNIVLSHMSK
jgi:hypothetical protein